MVVVTTVFLDGELSVTVGWFVPRDPILIAGIVPILENPIWLALSVVAVRNVPAFKVAPLRVTVGFETPETTTTAAAAAMGDVNAIVKTFDEIEALLQPEGVLLHEHVVVQEKVPDRVISSLPPLGIKI